MNENATTRRIVKRDSGPNSLATTLRRLQHTRDLHTRGITDNIIQILDPKVGVNPVMRAVLLRRQIRCLERVRA